MGAAPKRGALGALLAGGAAADVEGNVKGNLAPAAEGGCADSAGFSAGLGPKLKLAPVLEPGGGCAAPRKVEAPCGGEVGVRPVLKGVPKSILGLLGPPSAGLFVAPNKLPPPVPPAPPVLAPNAEAGGGAPAGVVEGLVKLNFGWAVAGAGVVEPKEDSVVGVVFGVLNKELEGGFDVVD